MVSSIQQLHIYVNVTVFRNITPSRLIDRHHLRGDLCLYLQGSKVFAIHRDIPCSNRLTNFYCMKLQVLTTVTITIVLVLLLLRHQGPEHMHQMHRSP